MSDPGRRDAVMRDDLCMCGHPRSEHQLTCACGCNAFHLRTKLPEASISDYTEAELRESIDYIRSLHVKDVDERGGTNGCKECGLGWPCPTAHFACGWGEMHDCWDAGWCSHAGVSVDPAEAGLIEPASTPEGETP